MLFRDKEKVLLHSDLKQYAEMGTEAENATYKSG